jgi:hypothetical protein
MINPAKKSTSTQFIIQKSTLYSNVYAVNITFLDIRTTLRGLFTKPLSREIE